MRRNLRSGHTLVEMTVVVTLLSAVMSLVVRAQRPYSEMVMELQDRATTSSELHLAVDFLATDLGAAADMVREGDSTLRIVREGLFAQRRGVADGAIDPGVRYSFRDGRIVRTDLVDQEEFVVASGLTGFEVSRPRGNETRITTRDGIADADQHSVTLVWRRP